MRDVPLGFDALWTSGDFTGPNKPMARVTVGHTDMALTDLGYNLYASIIFGVQAVAPKELPNVKSVKWTRGVDNEVATATLEFYNTAPQPLGTVFNRDWGLDQPGFYTFDHGRTSFSSRWGHQPNEWSNLIVPDNILRCVDTETEILSGRGWLRWDELTTDDRVLGVNPQTGRSEWQQVFEVFHKLVATDVTHLRTRTHDSVTTPNHRWLVRDRLSGELVWRETRTLRQRHGIPLAFPNGTQTDATYSNDFVELAAWFYTEGSTDHYDRRAGRSGGAIDQSRSANPQHVERLTQLFTRMFGEPGDLPRGRYVEQSVVEEALRLCDEGLSRAQVARKVGVAQATVGRWLRRRSSGSLRSKVPQWRLQERDDDHGRVRFIFTQRVADALREVIIGHCKVPSPEFLTALTADQAHLFVQVSIWADGTEGVRGDQYFIQKDAGRVAAFEMACALAGMATHTRVRNDGCSIISLLQTETTSPVSALQQGRVDAVSTERYEGVIWCPRVTHGNWVARRNGTVFYTGNTYEGYGFDPTVAPEKDPHLLPTGVWLIRDVDYTVSGLITVQCEDFASALLKDQICFYPVIPRNFYPLTFSSEPKHSGFRDGYTYTKTVSKDGTFDPKHPPPDGWVGPLTKVTGVQVGAGAGNLTFSWSPVPTPPVGYKVVGYNLIVDGVRLSELIPTAAPAASPVVYSRGIASGNVYLGQVAVVYLRVATGQEQVGQYSDPLYAYPSQVAAQVTSIAVDSGPPPSNVSQPNVPQPGYLAWNFTGTVNDFVVLIFKGTGPAQVNQIVPVSGTGTQYFNTGILTGLSGYSILIYPRVTGLQNGHIVGQAGKGFLFQGSGEFFRPPTYGVAPHQPNPAQHTPVVTTKNGTIPLSPTRVGARFLDSSNSYYVGAGQNVQVFGHSPAEAFDGSPTSFWLSIGNERQDQGYSFEWIEAELPNVELSQVQFITAKGNYFVYLSVYAKGNWVHYSKTAIIPYDPRNPESHNGGDIPYCGTTALDGSEGPHAITLKTPIPGATRARLTFHNLQDFGLGDFPYRSGVRDFRCFGSGATTFTNGNGAPPVPGPAQDDNSPDITQSYEVYVPPREIPGAGEMPGLYEDYTDIIKLFCAWAGFFWPQDASITLSDQTTVSYGFGPEIYGLKNTDPVLGGQDGGRVWGDFMQTGTNGIASFTLDVFDKKPLLDCITVIRDIIGYLFYIDESGGVVWRMPNIFSVGNYKLNMAADPGRVQTIITIDEAHTLLDLRAKLSGRNNRERVFVADLSGHAGALTAGLTPNPVKFRRVSVWTDAHWPDSIQAMRAADLIALRQLQSYRTDTLQIPAHLGIQPDDQVRIFERVTGEGYLHYVKNISSSNDLETGIFTYDLDTNWLGEDPDRLWLFDYQTLSDELKGYLQATQILPDGAQHPAGSLSNNPAPIGTADESVEPIVKLVQVTGLTPVYVTDGITYRWCRNTSDEAYLVNNKFVPSGIPTPITTVELGYMQLVGPAPS